VTSSTADYYLPAKWFTDAVIKNSLPAIAMLVFISAALFALVFRVVGGSYRNINSALKSHAASKKFKMTAQKKRSVVRSLALKEYRRMTGSTVYMTNGVMGGILAAVLGIAVLFIGFDRIVGFVTHDAPIDTSVLEPAIPFIVYFFVGMVATTAFTPSLEGKNFWIIQSMPIEMKNAYQGKMLFNMCLSVPFTIFSTLCFCISAKAAAADTILYLFLGLALCSFSTTWGCVCGIKHMRLDWENEVEVIKQGAAVTIYLLPNMLAVMALMVLSVYLGTLIGPKTVTALFTIIAIALAALSYRRVISLSKNSCYNVSRDRMKKRKRVRKRK
jgi:ABC-2 type transport system permease protein